MTTPPFPSVLPPALMPLATWRQFVLWRSEAGVKKPVDPRTGWVHDAHDPAAWMSHADAVAASARWPGCGLAFVFTENDPYFFVDVDKCLQPDNTWSPLAQQICAMLPGAAVEVSQSGRGLHLFARGRPPPHRCKSKSHPGLELYFSRRFVALTGTGVIGDAGVDLSSALPLLVETYFKPDEGDFLTSGSVNAWRDQPCPEWQGPSGDEELIALMLSSRPGVQSLLHGQATVKDLWTANAPALARTYPSGDPARAWDFSAADLALASHLAFWTGKNTERIRRIMWRSELRRQKWQQHDTYLWLTVSRACARDSDVYRQGAQATAQGAQPPVSGVELVRADSLHPQPVRWLWPGWLARGKLHVLAGAPGTSALARRTSSEEC